MGHENIDVKEQNFHGLHDNAIFSKFEIANATIFRNDIGWYFNIKSNGVNAGGLEQRLGGRMIMLGRIAVDGVAVLIGGKRKSGGYIELR